MESYTHNDLLLYFYKETSPEETLAIEKALSTNWNLRESFHELAVSVGNLKPINFEPREQSIDKILQYAERSIGELTTEA